MSIIWRERNSRIFKDMKLAEGQLLALFAGTLFNWSYAWGFISRDSIPLFLDSLSSCTYQKKRFPFFLYTHTHIYIYVFFSVVCAYISDLK